MDTTFNKLISRRTYKKATAVADPWETIPIKNRKYARECIEIHLANRGIQQLQDFENFPNLEVLYLNNNDLEEINGLDANFRIKNLYLFDNKIRTLEGSLEILTHLEILILYNNELRDLDKNIQFLKRYPNLKQLDLFKNPMCEEPNYRFRVIYNLPQVQLLDRHQVTYDERQKAKKLMEQEDFRKKKTEIKKRIAPSQMFSLAERDLYKEANKINRNNQKTIDDAILLEKTIKQEKARRQAEKDANYVPRSQMTILMEQRRKENPNSIITEFEKDKIQKIFKKYDTKKSAEVAKEDLGSLYNDLRNDEGIIGMVPACSSEEFAEIVNPDNLDKLDWDTYRYNLNLVYWEKPDIEMTEKRIKDYYHKANQKINRGKKEEAYQDINLAVRLQKKLDADDAQPVFQTTQKKQEKATRVDSFDFGRFTYRKTFQNTAKQIL